MHRFAQRLAWPAVTLGMLLAAAAGVAWDAARCRSVRREAQPQVQAVVRLLGTADLALSSASRWLRHPSLSEPGAAFADAPAILDADPAGALMAPPVAVLSGTLPGPGVVRPPPSAP